MFFTELSTWSYLLAGLRGTLTVALTAGGIALVLGLALMLGRPSGIRVLEAACRVVTDFFRGVPSLLLIYFFFLVVPQYGIRMSSFWMLFGSCPHARAHEWHPRARGGLPCRDRFLPRCAEPAVDLLLLPGGAPVRHQDVVVLDACLAGRPRGFGRARRGVSRGCECRSPRSDRGGAGARHEPVSREAQDRAAPGDQVRDPLAHLPARGRGEGHHGCICGELSRHAAERPCADHQL